MEVSFHTYKTRSGMIPPQGERNRFGPGLRHWSKLGVEASMAEAAAQRKAKAPEPKTPHSTRQSRHEEAENVYRRQVDLEIDASRHVVRKRVKNKT